MRILAACFVSASLIVGAGSAKANFLINSTFEQVTSTGGQFPQFSPDNWIVSAVNGSGGVVAIACPTFFGSGCAGKGNYVTTLQDAIPQGVLPKPVAFSQTVTLNPGDYRFGGEVALFVWQDALGTSSVLNESNVFLSIFTGVAPFPVTLLGRIDLSPQEFTPADFSITTGSGPIFRAKPFELFEDVFSVSGTDPIVVTMQLVVLPKLPPNTSSDDRFPLSSVTVYADNMFLEATRIEPVPVPAPGALGVFAIALAGLAIARRRKAA
ncbi:hypothetical protein [Elioraea sp.]|uniref:hypothetical protein n=1 Tax=Elioraea sp. TaxID=2185103 RepID=UPI0025B873E0|nr:hypothetical protein [Elioraea sp.]